MHIKMTGPEDITLSVMQTSLIVQTLSIMKEGQFNEITTAESSRWKPAGMPIWATEAEFSPPKQQCFSDSCRICLCLATDQSATLYSAQRMSEGVGPHRAIAC